MPVIVVPQENIETQAKWAKKPDAVVVAFSDETIVRLQEICNNIGIQKFHEVRTKHLPGCTVFLSDLLGPEEETPEDSDVVHREGDQTYVHWTNLSNKNLQDPLWVIGSASDQVDSFFVRFRMLEQHTSQEFTVIIQLPKFF